MGDLFAFTGNPFVDGGLWGLMEWLSVKDPADIDIQQLEEVFEEITDQIILNGLLITCSSGGLLTCVW